MQLYQNQKKSLTEIFAQTNLLHSSEQNEQHESEPHSKTWIDQALERLRAIFPTWRISDNAFLALSAEWGRTFGKWRVSPDEIDSAIELCKDEWGKVPDNVTKAFQEMLNRAIAKIKAERQPMQAEPKSHPVPEFELRTQIIGKIKAKHYADQKWGMKLAYDCATMLNSLEKTARQEKPKASEIEVLRIVEEMI